MSFATHLVSCIRDCQLVDAAAVAEIYNESVILGTVTCDIVPVTADAIATKISNLSDRETILVLERDGFILGWAGISQYHPRPGYRSCCEKSVYLRHSAIGQGYGDLLQRAAIARCRQWDYHHIVSRVLATNPRSIRFNQRYGFEVVGTQRQIAYLQGQWQDVVILQLILEDVPPYQPNLA